MQRAQPQYEEERDLYSSDDPNEEEYESNKVRVSPEVREANMKPVDKV